MNTKTMRLPPRRILMTEKRKEKDGVISSVVKSPESAVTKFSPPPNLAPPTVNSISKKALTVAEPVASNQLILAGYLSQEFLTNGTLFGEQWNPARAQTGPPEPKKVKPNHAVEPVEESEPKRKRYMEVANLLRADGTHMPGIVNPAQLARFLKL
ncbi:Uncharacterized protein Rs2_00381 [Raphanus sativus]|uniref:Uncharacterized protein LOC108823118 n=1 Tax=Raphanus sativus TaxID=3726 RepID=A0A9W3D7N1_RAPSA|nr:uncharacterized protein LOC108823118 [Raphanus sativus]XP_056859760.1 uncharacterized protein LOC108823118 [Raphanus sativus]KAJ4914831.1 Uncharacterized protein Rs2_00381 [Raphanus sativus]